MSIQIPSQTVRNVAALAALFCVFAVTGCSAGWTHLTRTRDIGDQGQAILVDAKQRAVISSKIKGKDGAEWLRVCAEPSPDALSALAASSGLNLSRKDSIELAQSLSLSEGAASIGLRTQSIQLMRDVMYRLCEGYLSGSLTNEGYETLHRRLHSSMVAILAIEQLTGVVKAPAVTLGGSAVTGSADLAAKYTEKAEQARAAVAKAATAEKEKQEAADKKTKAAKDLDDEKTKKEAELAELKKDAAANAGEIAKLEKELEELKPNIENAKTEKEQAETALANAKKDKTAREEELEAYDKARTAALAGSTRSAVTISVGSDTCCRQPSKEAVQAVSGAVTTIVEKMLALRFSPELCTTVLLNSETTSAPTAGSIVEKCVALLQQTVENSTRNNALLLEIEQILDVLSQQQQFSSTDVEILREAINAADVISDSVQLLNTELPSADVAVDELMKKLDNARQQKQ